MAVVITPNVVVCPHCEQEFIYNKVNGIALLQLINDIDARKRTYCRLALDDIERLVARDALTFPAVKKIFLDAMNDYTRAIGTELGFGNDVE